jgi:hypothetical protein
LAVTSGTRAVAVIVAVCPTPSVPIVHVNVLVPTAPVQVPTVLAGVAVNVKPAGSVSVTWTFVTAALVALDTGMLNVRVPPAATGSGESDLVIVAAVTCARTLAWLKPKWWLGSPTAMEGARLTEPVCTTAGELGAALALADTLNNGASSTNTPIHRRPDSLSRINYRTYAVRLGRNSGGVARKG